MAIQIVTKGTGGTIETMFLDRHPSSCTVTLYTGEGTAKVTDAVCTVEPLSTTIAAVVEAGDTTIDLASATSCYVGRRYLIGTGPGSQSPAETITVRSLTASTAVLSAPLMIDHAFGATVKGVRVSYAVTSTVADTVWWNGFADFNPHDGSDSQSETVECFLRKVPETGCDEVDLRRVFPAAAKALDVELDLWDARKQARDRFLYDLGGKNRANAFIGTDIFRDAVAMKFWLLRAFSMGDEWAAQLDRLQKQYDQLITDIQTQNPADNDQDGTTSGGDDGGFTVGRLDRA